MWANAPVLEPAIGQQTRQDAAEINAGGLWVFASQLMPNLPSDEVSALVSALAHSNHQSLPEYFQRLPRRLVWQAKCLHFLCGTHATLSAQDPNLMNAIVQFIVKHGYSILFAVVFAHQLGLPAPGPLFLLAAGALAAAGKLRLVAAVILSVIGCVLADWIWYEAGRRRGDKVLHLIDRLAPDPQAADRKAKKIFAHYGPPILMLAKFVPGLDAIAPPLCGTSGTGRVQFLAFDALGALLYSVTYAGLGYIFKHDLEQVAVYAGRAGTILAVLVFVGVAIYAVRTLTRQRRFARKSRVIQITPADKTSSSLALAASPSIIEGFNHGD